MMQRIMMMILCCSLLGCRLPPAAVTIRRRARSLTVTLPLELAGNPRRALVSARTHMDNLPLDWIAWRILEFE